MVLNFVTDYQVKSFTLQHASNHLSVYCVAHCLRIYICNKQVKHTSHLKRSNFDIYKADLANSGFITIFQYQESIFSKIANLCHNLKVPEACH
jgi:hypothetical protein